MWLAAWMNVDIVILTEVSHKQKGKYVMLLIYSI